MTAGTELDAAFVQTSAEALPGLSEEIAREPREAEAPRDKLGLALAGGGFRAALFHLGVLRRMAELDLLRYVEVLSTVSGGSIVGALYILELKRLLDGRDADPDRDDYVRLVERVHRTLVRGVRKNLRTRLLWDPIQLLRVAFTPHTLGRRMARLYERYLYREVVEELDAMRRSEEAPRPEGTAEETTSKNPLRRLRDRSEALVERPLPKRWLRPGRFPLEEIRARRDAVERAGGLEAFNRDAVERGGSAVTHLVVNATTLNSGGRFWFSSREIGDWYLGYVREEEIPKLRDRKRLLRREASFLRARLEEAAAEGDDTSPEGANRAGASADLLTRTVIVGETSFPYTAVAAAWWWKARRKPEAVAAAPPGLDAVFDVPGFPDRLAATDIGQLREAEIPAWYVQEGHPRNITGGRSKRSHLAAFWAEMRRIDEEMADGLRSYVGADWGRHQVVLDLVIEVYRTRTAEVVSGNVHRDWKRLTLGEAVGASASFPPVFPPYVLLGIYDDLHVARLGLTDGGVFDNIGITALLDERCNHIVASDTSGLLDVAQRSSTGRIGLAGRVIGVLSGAIAGFQRETLRERRRASRAVAPVAEGVLAPDVYRLLPESLQLASERLKDFHAVRELKGLAFFHIRSDPVDPPGGALEPWATPEDRHALAAMRTDLDGFGEAEVAALVNQGYETADRYIRKYLADTVYAAKGGTHWTPPDRRAVPITAGDYERLHAILEAGRRRLFRSLKLKAPLSLAATVDAVVVALVVASARLAATGADTSIADAVGAVGRWGWAGLTRTSWLLGLGWLGRPFPALLLLVGGAVLLGSILVLFLWRDRIRDWVGKHRDLGPVRLGATALKWIRAYAWMAVWLFTWIPALLALAFAGLMWLGYTLFYLPFLRRTALEKRRAGTRSG